MVTNNKLIIITQGSALKSTFKLSVGDGIIPVASMSCIPLHVTKIHGINGNVI